MKQLMRVIMFTFAMLILLVPVKKAEAARLNTPEELTWGKSYNIDASYCQSEYYKYTFTLTESGKVTFLIDAEEEDDFYIQIQDASGTRYVNNAISEGLESYSAHFLAGEYILYLYADSMLNLRQAYIKGSFIPTFTASGETVSEHYLNKNNQLGLATTYQVGQSVKAQFACNDSTDIYVVDIGKSGYLTMKFSSNVNKFDMTILSADGNLSYEETDIPLGASSYKYFVSKGTYYISFIRDGYNGTYTFSSKISDLPIIKIKSARNLKGRKAKITWTKRNDVDGYQVQVAQNKKFSKGKKSKSLAAGMINYGSVSISENPDNYTFVKLKKGKTYYVRVRTYKEVGGEKCYSAWSKIKKVKVKK